MRFLLIFLVLGWPVFVFASLSDAIKHLKLCESKFQSTKDTFSLVPVDSGIACSICHAAVGESDIFHDPCGHGYHASCLHKVFEYKEVIEQHSSCSECQNHGNYAAFLTHQIFLAPKLSEGVNFLSGIMEPHELMKTWYRAITFPSTEALQRMKKINFTSNFLRADGQPAELAVWAGCRATNENLKFLLDSGENFLSFKGEALPKGFLSSLVFSIFDNSATFLQRGVNVNHLFSNDTKPVLFLMIQMGNIDSVKFLIENNADLNIVGPDENTPLHFAILHDNAEIVELLMKTNRVDLNAVNKLKRNHVQSAACLGKLNALRVLLENGAPSNIITSEGYSLLQYVIAMGPTSSVKFLLNRGFMPIGKDGIFSYVLHLAVCLKRTGNIMFLLTNGADPNAHMPAPVLTYIQKSFPTYAPNFSRTDPAIVVAVLTENFEVFKALLEAGTDPNTKIFNFGCSLLHLVCQIGNVQMAKHLIALGVDHHSLDLNQRTPFSYNSHQFSEAVFQ